MPQLLELLAGGPRSSAQLQDDLGVSQPTVSRLLRQDTARVLRIDRGRRSRYALRRPIRDLPPTLPVYRISPRGQAREIGALSPVHGGFAWHDHEARRWDVFDSIPWFMDDMRPQGFLGHAFPRLHADLGLPERLDDWGEDHALYALARRGEDWVGNLLVGEESFARWTAHRPGPIAAADRAGRYAELAERALAGELGGSTPGGEQAKFTACVELGGVPRHLLVKFSERLSTPVGRRRADLLVCEHLALETAARAGLPAATSTVFEGGDRLFLEVQRFDRLAERGRRGVISLGAVDDRFVGRRGHWLETALELVHQQRLDADAAGQIGWLQAFGGFIANTDMHFGNLSLFHEGGPRFELAPAYDMLPMLYVPARGEIAEPAFVPPAPPARALEQARAAQTAAVAFWESISTETRISDAFRDIASRNARIVAAFGF